MLRGRSKGIRRGHGTSGTVTKAPLKKGLFSDGIWKCNCDPRLPAQHFQTKNGGRNHGRWFYTCQLPQPKRCDFFLWDDEAKGREAAAVLNNSRTEPYSEFTPVTPSKPLAFGLPTPQSERRGIGFDLDDVQTPHTPSKTARSVPTSTTNNKKVESTTQDTATAVGSSDDEFYDWPGSDDEEMGKVADQASSNRPSLHVAPMPLPETPRKAVKADMLSSPGKCRYDEMNEGAAADGSWPTPATGHGKDGDIFTTPSTKMDTNLFNTTLQSLAESPTPIRYRDLPPSHGSDLATEILTSLQSTLSAPLRSEACEKIKQICNRHVLYTRGIVKGRDVSRAVVKKKEERIVELEGEIAALKSQRETDRTVIRHLRRSTAQQQEGGAK